MAEKKSTNKTGVEKKESNLRLEEGLKKLQDIVKKLEANECELDEALKLFEEGVGYARACHQKLDEAEKKIEILTNVHESGITTKPFESNE